MRRPRATDARRPTDQPARVWPHLTAWTPVAGAVAHFQRAMVMDVDQSAKAMKDRDGAEIEDFLEGFKQPTYRGMRINGVQVATRQTSTDGPGTAAWVEFWTP